MVALIAARLAQSRMVPPASTAFAAAVERVRKRPAPQIAAAADSDSRWNASAAFSSMPNPTRIPVEMIRTRRR
jgi:hypothetical protein